MNTGKDIEATAYLRRLQIAKIDKAKRIFHFLLPITVIVFFSSVATLIYLIFYAN